MDAFLKKTIEMKQNIEFAEEFVPNMVHHVKDGHITTEDDVNEFAICVDFYESEGCIPETYLKCFEPRQTTTSDDDESDDDDSD